ncbi:hypothetical protein [Streptomyces sp. NPDC091879]
MKNLDQNHAPCPRPSKADLWFQSLGRVIFRILCVAAGFYIAAHLFNG